MALIGVTAVLPMDGGLLARNRGRASQLSEYA